jgi:flagellar hook-length control protein FliK
MALHAANLAIDGGGDGRSHVGKDAATADGSLADGAAGLSQANLQVPANAPAISSTFPPLPVHASVDSTDLAQGLTNRVVWMVDNGMNGAKLAVNPPQLGPIELRISVQGDHALISMVTHTTAARDALESSSPKLREMLTTQGFGQVSVDISQRSFQDRSGYTPYEPKSSPAAAAESFAVTGIAAAAPRVPQGVLDAYA